MQAVFVCADSEKIAAPSLRGVHWLASAPLSKHIRPVRFDLQNALME
ncbi:MAG TPA: hypothetical protein VGH80_08660 [Xanthomonadaceae bacterium]|jgi:hypothetical protein